MASLGPEQINMLTSLSDPAKLAKLKEAGLWQKGPEKKKSIYHHWSKK